MTVGGDWPQGGRGYADTPVGCSYAQVELERDALPMVWDKGCAMVQDMVLLSRSGRRLEKFEDRRSGGAHGEDVPPAVPGALR